VLVEIFDVGVAGQEPEQLVHDRFQVQLLGGEHREAVVERKAHLMAEHRQRAGAGAVVLFRATAENMLHQIEVLAHSTTYFRLDGRWGSLAPPATVRQALIRAFCYYRRTTEGTRL
jgi:hypothetical protein